MTKVSGLLSCCLLCYSRVFVISSAHTFSVVLCIGMGLNARVCAVYTLLWSTFPCHVFARWHTIISVCYECVWLKDYVRVSECLCIDERHFIGSNKIVSTTWIKWMCRRMHNAPLFFSLRMSSSQCFSPCIPMNGDSLGFTHAMI